jgi:hypothetical protein
MKFEKEIERILKARKTDTDMLNVIETLGYGADQFQRGFEVALEMDNLNLAKILYSNFDQGKVVVEFTLLGRK